MLQQTTVAAVVPFYQRWMAQFPNVEALAAADLDDILRLWSGLGYYARARNIKRAAEIIVRDYAGRLPSSVVALMLLPGVGRYTAGAIASIAYEERAPILDANVMRVLCRLHSVSGDIDLLATQKQLWQLAIADIPDGQARDFNQAMMELGALICLPAAPRCDACPVRCACAASATGDPTALPVRSRKTRWISVVDCGVVIEHGDRIIIVRRPENGLWGGLWEVPRGTVQEGESCRECAERIAQQRVGHAVRVGEKFGEHAHTVMNRKITLTGYRASIDDPPEALGADMALVAPKDVAGFAMASPQKALLALWTGAR